MSNTRAGDTAVFLLKEGADFSIKNSEEVLAIDLAPDKDVRANSSAGSLSPFRHTLLPFQRSCLLLLLPLLLND
jgi:hypothetical protein